MCSQPLHGYKLFIKTMMSISPFYLILSKVVNYWGKTVHWKRVYCKFDLAWPIIGWPQEAVIHDLPNHTISTICPHRPGIWDSETAYCSCNSIHYHNPPLICKVRYISIMYNVRKWSLQLIPRKYALVSVNPHIPLKGNPEDSDSFLISHPGDYDNGVQTQEQLWHLK